MAPQTDPATVGRIRALAGRGRTDTEIAVELGRSRWWISKVRGQHHIAPGRDQWAREQWRARSVGRFDLEDTDEL